MRPNTLAISIPSWGCLVGSVTAVPPPPPPQYTAVHLYSSPQSTGLVFPQFTSLVYHIPSSSIQQITPYYTSVYPLAYLSPPAVWPKLVPLCLYFPLSPFLLL